MRKSYRSIKRTSLLVLTLISSFVMAAPESSVERTPRAVVAKVQGNVFVTNGDKTKKVDAGSYLYDFDDIFTEVGAELVFRDYFDHEYHVSGSSYISVLNKIVELKSGYIWVKSMEETDDSFQLQTVNSTINYNNGEFIASYDPDNGKTQILSIKGTHTFNNNVYEFMKEKVGPGRFSFIKEDYENGAPRVPTPISSSAYQAVTSLFPAVKPMDERRIAAKAPTHKDNKIKQELYSKKAKRSTASVHLREEMRVSNKPGEIVVRRSTYDQTRRNIASVPVEENSRSEKLERIYREKMRKLASQAPAKKPVKKKFKPSYTKKSDVEVNIHRSNLRVPASDDSSTPDLPQMAPEIVPEKPAPVRKFRPAKPAPQAAPTPIKKSSSRNPASVPSPVRDDLKNDIFESSLRREYINQKKHNDAINSLINDLESYSQDYKQAY
ncbi:hypothetical protein DAY19_06270 [Halobacteriovorax vibrionivorans]|uniref:FecR protein domain-containing protein n=1 Tax=Halobacteriovorax vibrionivorans TaxID=2152716 RepID=A0ABY0IHF2_9BACT|nr:hypothetical protein [Halobacteriovorax vibrionivorans]RZF21286.1 hypothetical protein DAY19_06270 [Halobacteriovorax vibrionivorans]